MGVSSDGGMLETFSFRRAVATTASNLHDKEPPMSLPPTPPVSDKNSPEPLNLALSERDSLALPGEESDWVTVGRGDSGEADVLMGDDAPGIHEVQEAFSALYLMLNADTNADAEDQVSLSDGSESLDWSDPPLQLCNSRLRRLQPYLQDRLFDAFHLLHTDPSIQRIVVSLASDRAVCDAVMNNEVVRELITNVRYDIQNSDESPEDSGSAVDIIKRLFEKSATKIMDAMETITKYVTDLFKIPGDKEVTTTVLVTGAAPVIEKLQMTVLLTVVVLLIVLVTRAMIT